MEQLKKFNARRKWKVTMMILFFSDGLQTELWSRKESTQFWHWEDSKDWIWRTERRNLRHNHNNQWTPQRQKTRRRQKLNPRRSPPRRKTSENSQSPYGDVSLVIPLWNRSIPHSTCICSLWFNEFFCLFIKELYTSILLQEGWYDLFGRKNVVLFITDFLFTVIVTNLVSTKKNRRL